MRGLHKICHRLLLDAITHPPPLIAVVLTVFLSVFAVGFWCAHWIDQVDLAAYRSLNVFTDNIKGGNLLNQISSVLPIDVVYTWVNGSDPELLVGLKGLSQLNHDGSCPLSHCLPAPYISFLDDRPARIHVNEVFSSSEMLEFERTVVTHNDAPKNFTLIHLAEENFVPAAIKKVAQNFGNSSQPMQAYWTSDVGGGWGVKKRNAAIVTGGGTVTHEKLLTTLFPEHKDITTQCSVFGSSVVQVIECNEVEVVKDLLEMKINPHVLPDTVVKVRPAMLMLQPDREDHMKEIDANRFEDNEELRYSLRSLEKYAPWVRRVFIVTSGQIPYWINLDHPRLKIIQHEDIFVNKSHLPTFSSPAIESHIHRIPGLSKHFLYLNDDVMLGSEVWPEDFYSPDTGYKVYLSWSLPECSSGCPGSWLNDGYCDRSCNTSACEWDGGDCAGDKEESAIFDTDEEFGSDMAFDFCAPSCSDLWIADKYCDHSCNVRACGFDGGDCGLDGVRRLHKIPVPALTDVVHILPKGVFVAWMNISSLLDGGKTITGQHTEHTGIRSLNVNTAQGILFLLLRSNITATLRIELDVTEKVSGGQHSPQVNSTREYNITLKCNTSPSEEMVTKTVKVNSSKPPIITRNFTFDQVTPGYLKRDFHDTVDLEQQRYALVNVSASRLPLSIAKAVLLYEDMYRNGEITLNGLKKKKSLLISNVVSNGSYELVYYAPSEWPSRLGKDEVDKEENSDKNNFGKLSPSVGDLNHNESKNDVKNFTSRMLLWFREENSHSALLNSPRKLIKNLPVNNRNIVKEKYLEKKYVDNGNLPWERQMLFPVEDPVVKPNEGDYTIFHGGSRRLMDMFAESLLHVNRLYNSEFGYEARRVPAHMPHLVNKEIMEELQLRFEEEFELTSSHKIRQANDMQYAFSYFFYLMSKKEYRTTEEIFKSFDTDISGTLSDREIRTLLTRLYDLPLHYATVQALHYVIKNCSSLHQVQSVPTPVYERYSDSDIPTVSLELVLKCEPLRTLLNKLEKVRKYKYSQQSDDAVQFKMVTSNVSIVVHMLDEVRKHPRKFICLNSNLDPKSRDNELIHALVQDTYESLFPVPSTFELPLNYRNRFLYIKELHAWRRWRNFIRALIYACLASLIFLTLINFFSAELESLRRRWCRRRRRRDGLSGVRV